jgi:hypothetical protein
MTILGSSSCSLPFPFVFLASPFALLFFALAFALAPPPLPFFSLPFSAEGTMSRVYLERTSSSLSLSLFAKTRTMLSNLRGHAIFAIWHSLHINFFAMSLQGIPNLKHRLQA